MPEVWRFARRRCASGHDADDTVAETFAVAWRRRADVPVDDARLWLLGVARRVLANQHRSVRRRAGLRRRVEAIEGTGGTGPPLDPADVAAGRVDATLWRSLAALSADDRDLLIMRAWDQLPVTEMAVLLGCTPNAVSVRLHKARGRLAEALRSHGHHDGTDPRPPRTSDGRSLAPEGGQS
jgi:RNA polymerase sigma-70 factor (ECF subfamily)